MPKFTVLNTIDSDDEAKYSKPLLHNFNGYADPGEATNGDIDSNKNDNTDVVRDTNDSRLVETRLYAEGRIVAFNKKVRHCFYFMLASTAFWLINLAVLMYLQVTMREHCSVSIQFNEGALCIVTYLIILYAFDSAILGSAYRFSRDVLAGGRLRTINELLEHARPQNLSSMEHTINMGRHIMIKRTRRESRLPKTTSLIQKNKDSLRTAMEHLREVFSNAIDDNDISTDTPSTITNSPSLTGVLLTTNAVPLLTALVFLFLGIRTIGEIHEQPNRWTIDCLLIYTYDWCLVAIILLYSIIKLAPIVKRLFLLSRPRLGLP
jgi:hypothetical protein